MNIGTDFEMIADPSKRETLIGKYERLQRDAD